MTHDTGVSVSAPNTLVVSPAEWSQTAEQYTVNFYVTLTMTCSFDKQN